MSTAPGSTPADLQQTIADQQRQLAEQAADRDEALAREAAMTEVLGVINASARELAPVFEAMLERAMHLCNAAFGGLFLREGEQFRAVATRGLPDDLVDIVRRGFTGAPPVLRERGRIAAELCGTSGDRDRERPASDRDT